VDRLTDRRATDEELADLRVRAREWLKARGLPTVPVESELLYVIVRELEYHRAGEVQPDVGISEDGSRWLRAGKSESA